MNTIKWAYGITTVPKRREFEFVRTLESFKKSGFDQPHIFVDGDTNGESWWSEFSLPITTRFPSVGTAGNWCLSLAELYTRNPIANRYLLIQDDVIVSKGLREYLERVPYPKCGYLNLYTFPQNTPEGLRARHPYKKDAPEPPPKDFIGFYPSNQKGKGALALVFDSEAVKALITHHHIFNRFKTRLIERIAKPSLQKDYHQRNVDGGIIQSMTMAGFTEYVHNPSLVQHIGNISTSPTLAESNFKSPLAPNFRGESFDLITLKESNKYIS